ncbi:MAG: sulfite exporter TauE/SafE family protein [Lachnospiraceae bacterium]|nr:sulfite exporter TauE/SafE family protein [Lachnospiraceae bacterium]
MDKHIIYIGINGIYCEHCITTITNALKKLNGVTDVEIRNNVARVTGSPLPDPEALICTICDLGYETDAAHISERRWDVTPHIKAADFVMILSIMILIAYVCRRFFGFNIFTLIPTIDSSITYGMLVVIGLLTSLHCVCMCGALNLSASHESNSIRDYKRPLLYNVGRIISYTVTGGIVGLIGSVISIDTAISGIFVVAAAIVMLMLSLRMLGLVDFHLPHFMTSQKLFRLPKLKGRQSSLIIGLLNGLMPCGPLQAMQLYALTTGSAALGALSMFLFAIGTVPLMFTFGIASNLLTGKTREWFHKVSAMLVLVLSIVMANRGFSILGIHISQAGSRLTAADDQYESYLPATIEDGVQKVSFHLTYSDYADVLLLKDIPVEMNIIVDDGYLTGCNNEVISRDFGFDKPLSVGDNIITFTPNETGDYTYTCWMNMIDNQIKVIDDERYFRR